MDRKKVLLVGATSSVGQAIQSSSLSESYEFKPLSSQDIDLLDIENIEENLNTLLERNHFYGVILSAGVVNTHVLGSTSLKMFHKKMMNTFQVNCFGQVSVLHHLLYRKMIEKDGSIIFINSVAKDVQIFGNSIYAASKSALYSFMKNYASEHSYKSLIRFNSISPGQLESGVTANVIISDLERSNYPLGFGHPHELIGAVKLLLDPSRITGTDIVIDGGRKL